VDVSCAHGPSRGMVVADRRSSTARERSGAAEGREVAVAMDADLAAVREFLLARLSS
jgi:inosine-uridine nucleoside N-ribohydrolase